MSFRKWFGFTVASVLMGAPALTGGCGGGNNGSPGPGSAEGGSDGSSVVIKHPDGSTVAPSGDDGGTDANVGGTGMFDMTTGQKCTTDLDCKGTAPSSPGTNVCSSDYEYMFTGATITLYPTPICEIVPPMPNSGNCDPCGGTVPCDGAPHFCDGPDVPTSPGYCLPNNADAPQAGMGICVPYCTIPEDGSAPTGCVGNDHCSYFTSVLLEAADGGPGAVVNYGICQGGCDSTAGCADLGVGWDCQVDIGYCTKTKVTRTKPVGAACQGGTAANSDITLGNCQCLVFNDSNTMAGYCSSSCNVGGVACPSGYVCDPLEPYGALQFGPLDAGPTEPGFTKPTTTLEGYCLATCSMPTDAGLPPADASEALQEGGTAAEGGAAKCPSNSACRLETVGGPDCLP
jgi:hypothetical protein